MAERANKRQRNAIYREDGTLDHSAAANRDSNTMYVQLNLLIIHIYLLLIYAFVPLRDVFFYILPHLEHVTLHLIVLPSASQSQEMSRQST